LAKREPILTPGEADGWFALDGRGGYVEWALDTYGENIFDSTNTGSTGSDRQLR
jgi:hypothetical protein